MPEIVEIGISALKIEGRYKDADYVALTTGAYRKAVDEAWAGLPLEHHPRRGDCNWSRSTRAAWVRYFLTGTNHQAVVRGRAPRHRGVLMGRGVAGVAPTACSSSPTDAHDIAPLKPGDGVVFDAADWRSPEEPEEGGRVYQVAPTPRRPGWSCASATARSTSSASGRATCSGARTTRTSTRPRGLHGSPARRCAASRCTSRVIAHEGAPLVLNGRWRTGPTCASRVTRRAAAGARPQRRSLDADFLREQFGRLGNTPYELADVDARRRRAHRSPRLAAQPACGGRRWRQLAATAGRPSAHRPSHDPLAAVAAALGQSVAPARPSGTVRARRSCTCWCARRSSSTRRWSCARPASRSTTWSSTACARRWSACRRPGSWRASPARACSSPASSASSHFLLRLDCAILVRSGGLLHALAGRDAPGADRRLQPERGQRR